MTIIRISVISQINNMVSFTNSYRCDIISNDNINFTFFRVTTVIFSNPLNGSDRHQ